MSSNALVSASINPPFLVFLFPHPLIVLYCLAPCLFHPSYPQSDHIPVNAQFTLLHSFVHSSAFAVAVPLGSRRVLDTVIEEGTPLGVSNRYHHFAGTRDVPALDDSLRRSPQVSPGSPPISAFGAVSDATSGTASKVVGRRDPPGPEAAAGPPGPPLLRRLAPWLSTADVWTSWTAGTS